MTGPDGRRTEHPRTERARLDRARTERARLDRARTERARPERQRPSVWEILRNLALTLLALSAGWWLANFVFGVVGRPPELIAYLISIALTVFLAGVTAMIIGRLTGRLGDEPERLWKDLGDAMERIAHGDFSVRLASPRNGAFAEVVESVNRMAAGLGSVEQQRQEFISNVSHEIQSPLTSISGFASLLRDGSLDDATRQHYLDVIAAEAGRLSRLSDNLLRLSALDSADDIERADVAVDEQLRSVVLMLEPQWSARELEVELDTAPVMVRADADMLHQVWINLVNNAVRYTPPGGRVRISVAAGPDTCEVAVADTGVGIDADDLPRVFERFFRADKARSGEGSGLGLSLVRRVVDLHGGTVSVASEPGVGSTFTVSLPASASA
ncbi:sensor histidine kinase [Propionicimonas sp.]|uniref:sensor histidine kinase n=1 Tax=Propionicimonas sp. TaxID=1955623 RepID=UPI0039E5382B